MTASAADSHRLGSHGRAQRDSRAAEIAELRQRLQQLERAA